MPYSTPSSTTTTPITTPPGRPTHRRSYTNERGPGAFASLGALPRRTPPHFHLHHDNSSSNSSDSEEEHQPPPIKFRLQLNTVPVPFPRSSPSPSPLPSPRISQPPVRPSPSRTSSSPILLSNGKPLKSSLKGSSSSPNIVSLSKHSLHLRARSAPSTPAPELLSPTGSDQSISTPKNVHFPEQQLETVRLFNRSAKPASLLSLEETETESEAPQQGFPFPITPPAQPPAYTLQSDPIPNPNPPRHVIIESIRLKGLTITGTLLVRNVSFEKHVYVRFTLDDWQTTSEVAGHYSASLPCLPVSISPLTVGDIAAGIVPEAWDRFHYTIRLEDYAPSLASRTMYLVVRYAAGGGEWWDNNGGKNYRVQFSKGNTSPPPSTSTVPFPTVISTPATPPHTPPEQPVHVRTSSGEALEKRLRGFKLANYAKPSPKPYEGVFWMPASPVTPALSHSGSSDDDDDDEETPSPILERPRREAPISKKEVPASLPAPFSMLHSTSPPKSPPPMLKSPPPPRSKLTESPPSSSDDLYKAFVQKWCFVGGIGA